METGRDVRRARVRAIIGWAHLYFLFTFRWWLTVPQSFSEEGFRTLRALPVWGLEWLPRLPQTGVTTLLQLLVLFECWCAVLCLKEKTAPLALRLLWISLFGKLYFYALDLRQFTTFHHIHLLMIVVLLVATHRLSYLRGTLVVVYLCAGLAKWNPSWLEAAYFRSVGGGLPIFGESSTALIMASRGVVALELMGPLLWFSPNRQLRNLSLGLFLLFHLYSGLIVGFHFTLLMLPALLILLAPFSDPVRLPLKERNDKIAATVLLVAFLSGLSPLLLSEDVRFTARGRYFSTSNMVDANRWIQFEASFSKEGKRYLLRCMRPYPKSGLYNAPTYVMLSLNRMPFQHLSEDFVWQGNVVISPEFFQNTHVRTLGDPYLFLYATRMICERLQPDSLDVRLKMALNGSQQPRTVWELQDVCRKTVKFTPWGGIHR